MYLRYINTRSKGYEPKNINYRTDSFPTYGVGERFSQRRQPLFSYALPRSVAEVARHVLRSHWTVDRNEFRQCKLLVKEIQTGRLQGVICQTGTWTQTYHGLFGRGSSESRNRARQTECEQGTTGMAGRYRQGSQRHDLQTFFKRIGARYKRIRKRPKGKPSPQLYDYKFEKLQELESLSAQGRLDLYYADESHICTEGYVPYAWQLKGEDVYIPSQRSARLNIFGMVSRNNVYHGFTTQDNIGSKQVVDFLDRFSFTIKKKTVIVLDNASIHRSKQTAEIRKVWEKRGLFLFFLPPYSPHLNIIETLWRILKTKWIRPQDYTTTDQLFYSTNRALAAVGHEVYVKYGRIA